MDRLVQEDGVQDLYGDLYFSVPHYVKSVEQDADKIVMVYRDDYYQPDKTPTNLVEFNIVKNREGGIGSNKLTINLVSGKIGEPV